MIARMQVNSIWFCILGLVHPIHALVGLYISRQIPKFDQLTEKVNIKTSEQLQFRSTIRNLPLAYKSVFWDIYEPLQTPLKVYTISSLVCLILDCLGALVFLIFCAKREWAQAGVYFCQLLIVSIYFYLDVMLFINGAKLFLRLPQQF